MLGFDLNKALGDLVKYNFTSNQWEEVQHTVTPVRTAPGSAPADESSHWSHFSGGHLTALP